MRAVLIALLLTWLFPPQAWSVNYALLVDHHLWEHLVEHRHDHEVPHDHEDGGLPWHQHHDAPCAQSQVLVLVEGRVNMPVAVAQGEMERAVERGCDAPRGPFLYIWKPPKV
jgi:hypothetical protein